MNGQLRSTSNSSAKKKRKQILQSFNLVTSDAAWKMLFIALFIYIFYSCASWLTLIKLFCMISSFYTSFTRNSERRKESRKETNKQTTKRKGAYFCRATCERSIFVARRIDTWGVNSFPRVRLFSIEDIPVWPTVPRNADKQHKWGGGRWVKRKIGNSMRLLFHLVHQASSAFAHPQRASYRASL